MPALLRAGDDLVIHIGEVLHEADLITVGLEHPPHDVKDDVAARMADVADVVRRDAADIHANGAGFDRLERLDAAGERIVDAEGHLTTTKQPPGRRWPRLDRRRPALRSFFP